MKNLLLTLVAVTLFFSCGGNAATSKDDALKPAEKKEISLQLYSLRSDISKDYDSVLKSVADIGYTSIEAANYKDGKYYDKSPEEFKADLDKVGLKALSTHTSRYLTEKELQDKDFKEAMEWWNTCMDASKAVGMKYVVMPSMTKVKTLKDLQTYCEYYNEVGKLAKEKGLKFGYHNHAFEFDKVEDQIMYDYMLENTDPELVFFQMDVYWVVRGQKSPVDYFHKYPGRFKLLHIKDERELGQSGMVGFDAIFKPENTDIAGVEDIIVEVEKYSFEPIESVRLSYDYLLNHPEVKASYSK